MREGVGRSWPTPKPDPHPHNRIPTDEEMTRSDPDESPASQMHYHTRTSWFRVLAAEQARFVRNALVLGLDEPTASSLG